MTPDSESWNCEIAFSLSSLPSSHSSSTLSLSVLSHSCCPSRRPSPLSRPVIRARPHFAQPFFPSLLFPHRTMWPFSSPSSSVGSPRPTTEMNDKESEEKRLLRKVDCLLMPLLTISFGLQYYDKVRLLSLYSLSLLTTTLSRGESFPRKTQLFRNPPPFDSLLWTDPYFPRYQAVLGSASIFGIIKDLGLSTSSIDQTTGKTVVSTLRYSTANSAFYWG